MHCYRGLRSANPEARFSRSVLARENPISRPIVAETEFVITLDGHFSYYLPGPFFAQSGGKSTFRFGSGSSRAVDRTPWRLWPAVYAEADRQLPAQLGYSRPHARMTGIGTLAVAVCGRHVCCLGKSGRVLAAHVLLSLTPSRYVAAPGYRAASFELRCRQNKVSPRKSQRIGFSVRHTEVRILQRRRRDGRAHTGTSLPEGNSVLPVHLTNQLEDESDLWGPVPLPAAHDDR
jgi:hypothetical protein